MQLGCVYCFENEIIDFCLLKFIVLLSVNFMMLNISVLADEMKDISKRERLSIALGILKMGKPLRYTLATDLTAKSLPEKYLISTFHEWSKKTKITTGQIFLRSWYLKPFHSGNSTD